MKLLSKVNVKQGTDSQSRFSNGNTLPLTALPHSLAAFAPQTNASRGSWFYHPADRSLEGIRLTHQPSPWMGDFSYFTFMPQAESAYVSCDSRWSGFRPKDAKLYPHYLEIKLLRYNACIKLAPTDTGAVIELDFDDNVNIPRFAVMPPAFEGEITIDEQAREIYGYTTSNNGRPKAEFRYYFLFSFDCELTDSYVTDGENAHQGNHAAGVSAGANVALGSKHAQIRLATSYISINQARVNLARQPSTYSQTKKDAATAWEDVLGRIDVCGDKQMEKTFYSCLYRAFLYPTKFYEQDADGNTLHVVPETGEVKRGVMYTNNGFWDTYRTVYSLYSLIAPQKCNEIITAWLNFFDDTGYLPKWPSPSESGCMSGTLIEAVLADAVVKDIVDEATARKALSCMLKNAEVQSKDSLQGRKCVEQYRKLGYIPYDNCYESVNETLDCAYGDYAIAQVAAKLGEDKIAAEYYARSKNYKNLFDARVGFMRAKSANGEFRQTFNKYSWGLDYTEGSTHQTTFAVQHDLEGLASLYGGKDKMFAVLDKMISQPPLYSIGGYGGEIHEMTEMAAVDFGQCAISNQPSFHIPYIYAALGDKQKTVELVSKLVKLFSYRNDGFPGDEDNGTTACWYIFSTLGFYPVCPSRDEYIVSKPLFEKAALHVGGTITDVISLLKDRAVVTHSQLTAKD